MSREAVLFVRTTPALVAALEALRREKQARTPERRVSRNEIVVHMLQAGVRAARDTADAATTPDATPPTAAEAHLGRGVRARFVAV